MEEYKTDWFTRIISILAILISLILIGAQLVR